MIRKIISFLAFALLFCNVALAQQDEAIKLNNTNRKDVSLTFSFARVQFQVQSIKNNVAFVEVSLENLQQSELLMLFRYDFTEKDLKKKPYNCKFDKFFKGEKNHRKVFGCELLPAYHTLVMIEPSKTIELPLIEVHNQRTLTIPFYIARKEKKNKTTILDEKIIRFIVEVETWNTSDPEYVKTKAEVDSIVNVVDNTTFCSHAKHQPDLETQQAPISECIDQLKDKINNIRKNWFSDDIAHQAYTALIKQLDAIDLNSHTVPDCGHHKPKPDKGHSCSYCNMSEQQIYHQIDDLYQNMYNGDITKAEAVKRAKPLYECYQKNKKRKTNTGVGKKIKQIYNRIVNK